MDAPEGKSPKSLSDMADEVREVNEKNGWIHGERSFGDGIALLHSEVSEALEAYRRWGTEDMTWDLARSGESEPTYLDDGTVIPKPEGVGSEFADILIRLLDMCSEWGITLEDEYERKIAFNRTREFRHGGKRL